MNLCGISIPVGEALRAGSSETPQGVCFEVDRFRGLKVSGSKVLGREFKGVGFWIGLQFTEGLKGLDADHFSPCAPVSSQYVRIWD